MMIKVVIIPIQRIKIISNIQRGPRGVDIIIPVAPVAFNPGTRELSINDFTFTQTTNLAIWNIQHNLNKFAPSIRAFNNSGDELLGEISILDKNNLLFKMTIPSTGIAYLS
jgi:hypothetical protein